MDLVDDPMAEAQMRQSPLTTNNHSELLEHGMYQKENLCAVRENDVGTSGLSRETSKKRNRKGRGINLRKSLAWNQAFFTDEGVLDQQELSFLSRSSNKSSASPLSVRQMSPLAVNNDSNGRPPIHNLEANACRQPFTKFQSKDSKPRKLFHSSNEETEAQAASLFVTPGKTPQTKGIARSIPRSPVTYSQKRVANTSTANPSSKLPKFAPVRSNAPLLTSSRNAMVSTKVSKLDQSLAKVGQNTGLRLPKSKKDLACSSSLSNHGKNMIVNCSSILKENASQSSSKLHERLTANHGKTASLVPQSSNHVYGGPLAPAYARPSALRMPSPSLGFFGQAKVSPSHNNQPQRLTQPFESKIPSLRKPLNMRQNGQLKPLTTSIWQKPTKVTAAMNSIATSAIPSNLQTCLAGSFSEPANLDTYLHLKPKPEMKHADVLNRKACVNFESSYYQENSLEQLSSSVNPVSEMVKEVKYDNSSVIKNESFHDIQLIPETNFSEIVHDACSSTRSSIESELSCTDESQIARESKEIQDSGVGNHGEVTRDDICQVVIDNKCSDSDFNCVSDLECVFTAKNIGCTSSTKAESVSDEEMVDADSVDNLLLDQSSPPVSGVSSAQIAISGDACVTGRPNSSSEPKYFIDRSIQDCDSTNMVSSSEQDTLPGNKMHIEIPEQGLLLNAVPFSDEWVAAVEAFGEDILVKKTGAVQNSPPEKDLPEPSPWSPVKKKAQDIGPYDCTKYSKNLATSSTD